MWTYFQLTALLAAIPMIGGTLISYAPASTISIKNRDRLSLSLFALGPIVLGIFIAMLWVTLDRPPMRTLGETRVLYSFFLPLVGFSLYIQWRQRWMLVYTLGMTIIFLSINLLHPENFSKSLMPALVSPWFVPHVVVYIFSYAMLAASALVGLKGLVDNYRGKLTKKLELNLIKQADQLVFIGFGFLTAGLLFGAIWAKEAWGHYWTWDPKETWAFITWAIYLIYIHYRVQHKNHRTQAFNILVVGFIFLMICWVGVNYLPSASTSVHTYTN
jgi:cytochrome c-type biogenesis protein CcsB